MISTKIYTKWQATKQACAIVLILSLFLNNCATFKSAFFTVDTERTLTPVSADYQKIRIVVLPFQNSAQLREFAIIPDGNYDDKIFIPGESSQDSPSGENLFADEEDSQDEKANGSTEQILEGKTTEVQGKLEAAEMEETNSKQSNESPNVSEVSAQDLAASNQAFSILPGELFREIAETELFQSGRFEVIPYSTFLAERKRIDPNLEQETSQLDAARNLNALLVTGDCTDFEIKRNNQLWKVPLWTIVLIGSFFIKDDDLRNFVWQTLIRLVVYVPLDSDFWKLGVGWQDLMLNVNIALNLRVVSQDGSLVFSDESEVQRTESVRNLDLLLWKEDQSLKIERTNAAKQIRYGVVDLTNQLADYADRQQPGVNP